MFEDHSGMAVSMFLAVAVASVSSYCVLHREGFKSHCNGCMKVTNGALAANYWDFGVDDLLLKFLCKKCYKIVVFPLWRKDLSGFGAAKSYNLWSTKCVILLRFASTVSADRSRMAASTLLAAAAASVNIVAGTYFVQAL